MGEYIESKNSKECYAHYLAMKRFLRQEKKNNDSVDFPLIL